MEEITSASFYDCRCVQVVPYGKNRCAVLFAIGNKDHSLAYSVVFEVEDFDCNRSATILVENKWFTSLAVPKPGELYALEAGQNLWHLQQQQWTTTRLSKPMNKIWSLNKQLTLAVGNGGSVILDDNDLQNITNGEKEIILNDVHGTGAGAVYAVGNGGIMQHLTGAEWQRLPAGTTADLRGVFVGQDGVVSCCGSEGLCLAITGKDIKQWKAPDSDFFAVHGFKGDVFWGDGEFGVYKQKRLKLVEFEETEAVFDFHSDYDFMYAAGEGTAWRFDGENWKSLTLDFDGAFRLR